MCEAIPPLPQYTFMVWCLVKHMDNFTFTFTHAITALDSVIIHYLKYFPFIIPSHVYEVSCSSTLYKHYIMYKGNVFFDVIGQQ
jgi:hypothetical protein